MNACVELASMFWAWLTATSSRLTRVLSGGVAEARTNIGTYDQTFDKGLGESLDHDNASLTDLFYNLVTDFYEWGWGSSFHFASRFRGETFHESILRHEYYMAGKLQLKVGEKALDMGMGVGGPLREMVRFTGAEIQGVTINAYQIARANTLTPKGIKHLCKYDQADFSKLPYNDNTFDKAFQIEAFVHMHNRKLPYSEAFRVLKPGGLMCSYEWLLTDKFDFGNEEHMKIKRGIEHGNGLPDQVTIPDCLKQIREAGFEILEHEDLVEVSKLKFGADNVPWYAALCPDTDLVNGFLRSTQGRFCTRTLLAVLEALRLAPAGSGKTADMLEDGAKGLVAAGKRGIFTPMYYVLARKPSKTTT